MRFCARALALAATMGFGATVHAETCQLIPVDSVDAERGELTYFRDSDSLQALLITHHRYEDNSTMITVIPMVCPGGNPNECTGTVIEDFGQERTFWRTQLTRQGNQVTADHTGARDPQIVNLLQDGRYWDVFQIGECEGASVLEPEK